MGEIREFVYLRLCRDLFYLVYCEQHSCHLYLDGDCTEPIDLLGEPEQTRNRLFGGMRRVWWGMLPCMLRLTWSSLDHVILTLIINQMIVV